MEDGRRETGRSGVEEVGDRTKGKSIESMSPSGPVRDQACWQQIGVWGDRTCSELSAERSAEQSTEISHCHYCTVYQSAGARLLDRAMPLDYLRSQTAQVAEPIKADLGEACSALIFRLGTEWLAIPAELCQQILSPIVEHTLPHRSNSTLLGMVNVRGQLLLKISLLPVLGLKQKTTALIAARSMAVNGAKEPGQLENSRGDLPRTYRRMVVVSKLLESGTADIWTFEVDEMYGIQAVAFEDLQAAAAGDTCTRYVFDWQGHRVSFLDEIKLFDRVRAQAL